jgi:hypothetical protein
MLPQWTVPTNYDLGTIQEREAVDIALPLGSTDGVTSTVISGELPAGLRIEENRIVGRLLEVSRDTLSNFVIRASTTEGVSDRTFNMIIQGPDSPNWITPEGRLPVGPNNVLFILDSSVIDYQLLASDPDLPAGDVLMYFVDDDGGELPPGITLTSDGRLVGVVDPLLALDINAINGGYDVPVYGSVPFDFSVVSDNGLDSFFYDTTLYDYSVPTRNPRKLNRNYDFEVTVTDGDEFSVRRFSIYVVGDDFARADNTIMKAADGVYTADMTYIRAPIWLTPSDLGVKRADNYITVYLDTLEQNVTGEILYFLEGYNPDGTPSKIPRGTAIDQITGEIAGRVPYQPAITKDYKFTVTATRFNELEGVINVFGTYNYEVQSGGTLVRIGKLDDTLVDGLNDLQNLVEKEIVIEGVTYTVKSVSDANANYDLIELYEPLQPTFVALPLSVSRVANGTDYFFVNSLATADKDFYLEKSLNFSDSEMYLMQDIYPYIEWRVSTDDSVTELVTDITGTGAIDTILEDLLSIPTRPAYVEVAADGKSVVMFIPSTAQNRNANFIKSLFHTEDSGEVFAEILAEEDRIKINNTLTRTFSTNRQLSFGTYTGGFFSKSFSRGEIDEVSKSKTFTLRLLGEIDSTISWITDPELATLRANRISTLNVEAVTTIPGGLLKYDLVAGRLPPGIVLKGDGELVGKVPINGTPAQPGLTFFDTGETTFDGAATTLDRVYTFTVLARDRFGFSATSREFTLRISDLDNLTYSNIYIRPFLKSVQKNTFSAFINDASVINPRDVYRPSDPSFGVQKELRALIYGGIETDEIDVFVGAAATNHKRKKYYLGDLKTALAKTEGTDNVVYEVIYIDLIDPALPFAGKARKSFNIINDSVRITADTSRYEVPDDDPTDPHKYRPAPANPITADLNAINVSQNNDTKKYISNIDNMRDNIKATGQSSRDFLPLWMRTAQDSRLVQLDYKLAVPLVYCKPGTGQAIYENILNTGFDFTTIDYDIDRYIIDTTTGKSQEQYIVFANYQFNV